MTFARVGLAVLLSWACIAGGGEDPPEEPAIDASRDPPAEDAAPPPAPPPTEEEPPLEPPPEPTWSDIDECNAMCGAYCSKRHFCGGTPAEVCRDEIDAANGGPCEGRGHTFADISQERVRSCIAALQAMSCPDFLSMFDTGAGVPEPCHGILD